MEACYRKASRRLGKSSSTSAALSSNWLTKNCGSWSRRPWRMTCSLSEPGRPRADKRGTRGSISSSRRESSFALGDSNPVDRVRFPRRLPRLDRPADPEVEEHGLAEFRHRETSVRQRVRDPRRARRFHVPSDQAVLLHPRELAREDARTDGAE